MYKAHRLILTAHTDCRFNKNKQFKTLLDTLDLFDNSVSFGTLIFTYSVVCLITLILYQIKSYVNTIVTNYFLNISIIIKN